MISLDIPGVGSYAWTELVLDVNGTLSTDGVLIPGVAERIGALAQQLSIHLLTANTRGTAGEIATHLNVGWSQLGAGQEAEQKRAYVDALGANQVIAVGNGNNDTLMLTTAGLGIAVLGPEGTASRAILSADLVARDILEALDILLDPTRLLATLRC